MDGFCGIFGCELRVTYDDQEWPGRLITSWYRRNNVAGSAALSAQLGS